MEALRQELRFKHPDYWRADSYTLYEMTDGEKGWDGYIYPLKIDKVIDGANVFYRGNILRGHLDKLLMKAARLGIVVDRKKMLPRPFEHLQPDDIPDDLTEAPYQLDEGQRRCVTEWLKKTFGVNRVAVNGGKTFMFATAAGFIKRAYPSARFLYFTQTERLVKQTSREMRKFLPAFDVGQFGGGHHEKDAKDMVIATMAMLSRHFKTLKKDGWFKRFMAVFADESHHVASPTCEKVLLATPAFFRFGASDSVKDEHILQRTAIEGLIGPVLNHAIHSEELIRSGRSARPYIYLVDIEDWKNRFVGLKHQVEEGSKAWVLVENTWKKATYMGRAYDHDPDAADGVKRNKKGEPITLPNHHRVVFDDSGGVETEVASTWCLLERMYDKAIIRFQERNNLIARWAEHFSSRDMPTVVICTRTLHVMILYSLIRKRMLPSKVKMLYAEHDSKERDSVFQWLRETPGAVLVTSLIKEGVSINEIQAGIIADHVVDWEVANQYIGRFIRKKVEGVDNSAHIVWFIDRQHPHYWSNSIRLFRKLEKIRGYSYYHPVSGPETVSQSLYFAPAA